MNYATYTAEGRQFYGIDTGAGMIACSPHYPGLPTLRDVIAGPGLEALRAYQDAPVTHTDFSYDIPLPNPEKIICVGVNFPDRNAEYKDGVQAPPNMSLFVRFARSFVGHQGKVLRPFESGQLDYEAEIAIVMAKVDAGFRRPAHWII